MEKEYSFVIVAGILSGLVIFGARVFANLGLSLYQIAVFSGLFIFLLLPLILFKKGFGLRREPLKIFVIFGFIGALSTFTEFGPIILGVPVAVVVLLLYTHPLWTVILGRVLLHEEITKRKIAALAFVLAGVFILVNPFTAGSIGSMTGVILASMGGLLLSCWFILGRVSGIRKYNPVTTQFGYYIFLLLFMLIFYPFVSFFVTDASIINISPVLPLEVWFYLMLYGVFAITIPHVLFLHGSKKVHASEAGIIFLLEPVSASVLAALVFNEPITLSILAGGALILFSNYIIIRKRRS